MKIAYRGFIYESFLDDEEDSNIEKIERDSDHEYQYLDHILYRLGNSGTDFPLEVSKIEETPENTFYPDQIERYEEYIKDGGIIDSFPVSVSPLEYELEPMSVFISECDHTNPAYEDDAWKLFEGNTLGLTSYNFEDIFIYNDEDEKFGKYARLNPKARDISQCFPPDMTEDEKALLPILTKVFQFFKDNQEYTLTNMNHRFQAVKNLGATVVMVEPV